MLKSYTNKPENFKYIDEYKDVLKEIVSKKKDYLWKNWVDFNFDEQSALTVGLEDNKVKVISSIINKDIWPKGVYRLMSRYYVDDDVPGEEYLKCNYDSESAFVSYSANFIYHFFLFRCFRGFEFEVNQYSSKFYRGINEVPTLLLIIIIFVVVFKPL